MLHLPPRDGPHSRPPVDVAGTQIVDFSVPIQSTTHRPPSILRITAELRSEPTLRSLDQRTLRSSVTSLTTIINKKVKMKVNSKNIYTKTLCSGISAKQIVTEYRSGTWALSRNFPKHAFIVLRLQIPKGKHPFLPSTRTGESLPRPPLQ